MNFRPRPALPEGSKTAKLQISGRFDPRWFLRWPTASTRGTAQEIHKSLPQPKTCSSPYPIRDRSHAWIHTVKRTPSLSCFPLIRVKADGVRQPDGSGDWVERRQPSILGLQVPEPSRPRGLRNCRARWTVLSAISSRGSPHIKNVHVDPEPCIVGKIPARMVGVVIDHDRVGVPKPAVDIRHIEGGHAPIVVVEPEAAGTSAL